jgi:hypothetical protein
MTKKHFYKARLEEEEYDEEDYYKMRKSYRKARQQRCHTNWKRTWLDHPNDFDAIDDFYGK